MNDEPVEEWAARREKVRPEHTHPLKDGGGRHRKV
jgi:hypothetical protein